MRSLERTPLIETDRGRIALGSRTVAYTVRHPEEGWDHAYIFVPGFMAGEQTYERVARCLAEAGSLTVTMAHEGADPACSDEINTVIDRTALRYADDDLNATLVSHSFGGINAVQSVEDDGSGVEGLLFEAAVGFGGVRPWMAIPELSREMRYVGGVRNMWLETKIAAYGLKYARRSGRHLAPTVFEASTAHMPERVQKLSQRYLMGGVIHDDDSLVDPIRTKQGLMASGVNVIEHVKGYAGHNAQMYRPYAVMRSIQRVQAAQKVKIPQQRTRSK